MEEDFDMIYDSNVDDSDPNANKKRRYKLVSGSKVRRLQRLKLKLSQRISNRVDDLHKKLASWLVHNYDVVIIPKFETKGMVNRHKRKIPKRVVRGLLTWSHYRFRETLMSMARRTGATIVVADEVFTSKSCGYCPYNKPCGKKYTEKHFTCTKCNNNSDRDINAARNILLRYLTVNNIAIFE